MTNNQKEILFSNKLIQKFLDSQSKESLKNNSKFAEIAFSLAYYLMIIHSLCKKKRPLLQSSRLFDNMRNELLRHLLTYP